VISLVRATVYPVQDLARVRLRIPWGGMNEDDTSLSGRLWAEHSPPGVRMATGRLLDPPASPLGGLEGSLDVWVGVSRSVRLRHIGSIEPA
jgi:hypothetical protein